LIYIGFVAIMEHRHLIVPVSCMIASIVNHQRSCDCPSYCSEKWRKNALPCRAFLQRIQHSCVWTRCINVV